MVLALFALGLQGKGTIPSRSWLVDFAVSNHMINSPDMLSNVCEYTGFSKIQVANGHLWPIIGAGNIAPSLTNIIVSPRLSTSLNSVKQLVDYNYNF